MAVIFLKILGSAGKQLRIVGRPALNGLDHHKDYSLVRGGGECSAEQNLNQLQTNSRLPGPGAQKPLSLSVALGTGGRASLPPRSSQMSVRFSFWAAEHQPIE